jgi:hypothetical protein
MNRPRLFQRKTAAQPSRVRPQMTEDRIITPDCAVDLLRVWLRDNNVWSIHIFDSGSLRAIANGSTESVVLETLSEYPRIQRAAEAAERSLDDAGYGRAIR